MALLQSNVLEFIVSGSLDGVTPNPVFQRANAVVPRPTPPGQDPDNIYRFEVQDLGIVDLTFPSLLERPDGPVTTGNRYVVWTMIDTDGVVAAAGASVSVAAFRPGGSVPIVQEPVIPFAGLVGVYSRRCVFVPHGSALRLTGVVAGANPIIVRMAILLPFTRREEELIVKACCCLDGIPDTIPSGCVDPPNPDDVDPDTLSSGPDPVTVTVTGSNFQEGDTVSIPGLSFGPTTFVSDTELQVDVTPSTPGTYDVIVTRPGEEDCSGEISDAFIVE